MTNNILTKTYTCGDPADPDTKVGTVIDEPAAIYLEKVVEQAVQQRARILLVSCQPYFDALPSASELRAVSHETSKLVTRSFDRNDNTMLTRH